MGIVLHCRGNYLYKLKKIILKPTNLIITQDKNQNSTFTMMLKDTNKQMVLYIDIGRNAIICIDFVAIFRWVGYI